MLCADNIMIKMHIQYIVYTMTANGTMVQFHSGEVFSPFKILLKCSPSHGARKTNIDGEHR